MGICTMTLEETPIKDNPKIIQRKLDQLKFHCKDFNEEDIQYLIDLAKSWKKGVEI